MPRPRPRANKQSRGAAARGDGVAQPRRVRRVADVVAQRRRVDLGDERADVAADVAPVREDRVRGRDGDLGPVGRPVDGADARGHVLRGPAPDLATDASASPPLSKSSRDAARGPDDAAEVAARPRVDDAHRRVRGRGDEVVAVGRPAHCRDDAPEPDDGDDGLRRRHVPDAHGLVVGAGGQLRAVRAYDMRRRLFKPPSKAPSRPRDAGAGLGARQRTLSEWSAMDRERRALL